MDHQLFIVALTAIYLLKNWKQVLVLVTAFTIGHSVTLALSVFNMVKINEQWVEFLIPCTIVITSIFNFFQKNMNENKLRLNYFFALFFGLVHGLGFANTIKFMLAKNQSIAGCLLGFNVGLEVGQIIIVIMVLLTSFLVVNIARLNQKWWVWGLSTTTFMLALKFAVERIP